MRQHLLIGTGGTGSPVRIAPLRGHRRDTMTRTFANNLTAIVFTLAVTGYAIALLAHTAIKIAA